LPVGGEAVGHVHGGPLARSGLHGNSSRTACFRLGLYRTLGLIGNRQVVQCSLRGFNPTDASQPLLTPVTDPRANLWLTQTNPAARSPTSAQRRLLECAPYGESQPIRQSTRRTIDRLRDDYHRLIRKFRGGAPQQCASGFSRIPPAPRVWPRSVFATCRARWRVNLKREFVWGTSYLEVPDTSDGPGPSDRSQCVFSRVALWSVPPSGRG
jgi:hypothetical protein